MVACFLWVVCSSPRKVNCSLVAVCPYCIASTPSPSRVYEVRAEPDALPWSFWLLPATPRTVVEAMRPPGLVVLGVAFHLHVMDGAPPFRRIVLSLFLDNRELL